MRSVLFYIAGATTVGIFFTLWCAVAVQRVRKESEYLGWSMRHTWTSEERKFICTANARNAEGS